MRTSTPEHLAEGGASSPAELAAEAYLDRPPPIPHSQVTTQPSLVAKMVEALELAGRERVLEVGGGHAHFVPIYGRHGFAP